MKINQTKIQGVYEVYRDPIKDNRGLFERLYCEKTLKKCFSKHKIVQINHSITINKGSIRGMHLQLGDSAEIKMISCLKGNVYDVALDLRKKSSTFLQWVAINLSPDKYNAIIIPKGVAHGFQTLSDNCELLYFHSENYSPENELGVSYKEPRAKIDWPLPLSQISDRDTSFKKLDLDFLGFEI